jgi:hypothetical protein
MRPDAYNGRTWPCAEARDATETRLQSAGQSTGQPTPGATRAAVSPPHSAGYEATSGPKCHQAAPIFHGGETSFKCLPRDRPRPQDAQQG